MPPKGAKRRTASPIGKTNGFGTKKVKHEANGHGDDLRQPHPFAEDAEEHGIVLRRFYPHEMSNARAHAYNSDEIPRPMEVLITALEETGGVRKQVNVGEAVVHWFKMDLRHTDNRSLALASAKAKEAGVPLICLYIVSPQDFEAHLTAPVRVDFMLRTLSVLKADLAALDIPLYVETVDKRKKIPHRILELMNEWGSNHLFANIEYEVDELRREAQMIRHFAENNKSLEVVHDTCVVPPGELRSGSGKQYAVYTPWYRAWMAHIHENLDLLELYDRPEKNPDGVRKKFEHLFDCRIPDAPKNKRLSDEEKKKFHALWPCGEHVAMSRLADFCEEAIGSYHNKRNIPGDNVNWPYVCMNKPFKPEYSNIQWSYDKDHFAAWCEGRTGFPIVDAAMRQLNHMGYMHNRCRMIVASFISKDLLIDWRMGERYFMEHLIDGDFASNNGGWGFSASVGVDPQPYFRIFNPLLQSEKFDPNGEYIRKWVPELRGLSNKEIHDPYNRGAGTKAKKQGYPKQLVEHKGARDRALSAYKGGLESGM
ncbi:deoxyribodipyrimidine photo-lyase [Trichoderma arundinaceum]|uniref:Deoxyribodipyrimidine photo-lyase n=1 Tax=Trichoderma arundinaceum TaxID=490622 RepID=A0A395NBT4_TRIAR|nr:deoxyribodipyrimidine photo-lyase [Trichoderma arundinaceum]